MKLSKRLELVASMAPEKSRVADVGTDHGYIPIALVERGIAVNAIAMDLRPGPLRRAEDHIRQAGLRGMIQTRLSDGLLKLSPGEADVAVIAGMGGELIIHILDEGRHVWQDMGRFILSPQSDLDKVRRYLREQGFGFIDEAMVEEEGKFYTVMAVSQTEGMPWIPAWDQESIYLYGPVLIEKKDPVLLRFLDKEQKRIEGVLNHLKNQRTVCGKATEGALTAEKEMERQLHKIDEALRLMGTE